MKEKNTRTHKHTAQQKQVALPPHGGSRRIALLRPPWPYLVLVCIILIVYVQSFSFGYTEFDDGRLVHEKYSILKDFSGIKDILKRDVFLSAVDGTFYRPMQVLSYFVDTAAGGTHAGSYHISNVIFHCAVSCSLLSLLFLMRFKNLTALLLAALYAVHPVFVQSVCWIPSRGDLLICLFAIWTMIFYLRYIENGKMLYLILQGLFYLFAAFSKETAVLFPIVLVSGSYLLHPKSMSRKRILPAALIWVVVFGVWFILRNNVITSAGTADVTGIGPLISNLPAIPVFISIFFIPLSLAPIPSFTVLPIITGIILIVGLATFAFFSGKLRDPHFLIGMIWFAVFIGPGLWFRPLIGGNAYDYLTHRLYLPAVGLVIAIATLLQMEHSVVSKWILIAGGVAVVGGGIYSRMLSQYYDSPQTFYDFAVAMNPVSALARSNRGAIYRDRGKVDLAFADFDEAIRLRPDFPEPFYNRGTVQMGEGKPGEAERDFTHVISLDAKHLQAINSRGAARGMLGNMRGAIEDFDRAVQVNPGFAEAYYNRGMAKRQIKDVQGALSDFTIAIRCNPSYADAYLNRAMVKGSTGDYKGAVADLTEVIRYKPDEAIVYRNRGIAKMKLSDSAGAREDWTRAAQLQDPLAPEFLKNNFH